MRDDGKEKVDMLSFDDVAVEISSELHEDGGGANGDGGREGKGGPFTPVCAGGEDTCGEGVAVASVRAPARKACRSADGPAEAMGGSSVRAC